MQKKVDKINYGQVLFRAGVDRKTAVEGKDKFTGYTAVARWAYKDGYFKTYVVDTEDGMKILEKAGKSPSVL